MFGKKIYIFFHTEELKYLFDFKLNLFIETVEPPEVCYEEFFQKSEKNDTALELEEKILHVIEKRQ
ncbi:hypothetical protein CAEBREN_26124 [Caenorhabditis brenneri]|uniref:Uncharacterized protein n=1 Tax=Caenorhabditis brenneri TaxID=135651 RepID=G0NDE1_CAEBE|nr:hypothetical protein CAEBREN_26124 [Caenorhabditis brenneri]